jgi:transcriptional regulator with XRE-family HTH domain
MSRRGINGAAVKALREAVGIKHGDFAERVGIHKGTLTHIEKGERTASPALQRRIADALKVELDAISVLMPTTEERDEERDAA